MRTDTPIDLHSQAPLPIVTVVTGDPADHDPALRRALHEVRTRGVPGHAVTFTESLTPPAGDLIFLCAAGAAADREARLAQSAGVPVVSSFGTGAPHASRLILSPTGAADSQLAGTGVEPIRIRRWELGVNPEHFSPAHYHPEAIPAAAGRVNVLHSDPLDDAGDVDLLADAFGLARQRDPRLHLILAGSSEAPPRRLLGSATTVLGELSVSALAQAYASADLLVCVRAGAYGQPILEAQASGLPVLAVGDGAAGELIQSGRSGCLVPRSPIALAEAICSLARRATLRERLATGGLLISRGRNWERSLLQLAAAWSDALAPDDLAPEVAHAA